MTVLENFVSTVNSILWDYVLVVGLVGIGIYTSIKLGFPQIKCFGAAAKKVFGGIFKKETNKEGTMSSFQALATSIAAQIGTGNIAGVATAISLGGPGAVFWMWISAFFGMSTIFVEATMAQKYRETTKDGQLVGGPAYYIKNGLGSKGLASFFAIALIIALGFIGNMVQSNSIADAVSRSFNIPQLAIGIILAVFAGLIFIGGMKRIASFAEMVVPIMAAIYILGAIVIMVIFRADLIPTIKGIIIAAFSAKSVLGGAAGIGVQQAIRFGIARGLFSNEAGMGSTPNSHAVADVSHPAEQGLSSMIAVFIDTILVCTSTAVVILATGAHNSGAIGVGMTQEAFNIAFGPIGGMFLAICLTFFAFTTVVGWYYFGENNIRFLFKGKNAIHIYQIVVLIFIILGSYQKVDFVWSLADMFNGIMVIPNLIAIFCLFKESNAILQDYNNQIHNNERLHYEYKYQQTKTNLS
ncbi:alanine/glycine:cation symporter family protein [Sedimentibacter sp. MB31-C6]|uniref:alanine/glycine:cation symporter family protein n=1 Tax=Sedimentibacter sp. MB31-C6 TaxID=3109366 RepID=UPI002DDCF411|nr:sodium:alanine symporter family protein [Sedimentibacter sp. MB36-C1]WSI04350.1 sodium:alanine symporter family protein [Sedimentibacter sp. MB36-C1]